MTGDMAHKAGPRLEIDHPESGWGIDKIRALFTYSTAWIVVVGGGIMLFISRSDPNISDIRVVMAGFIGLSLNFLYGQEVQTRTARQAASSTAATTAATVAATAAANSGVGPSADGSPTS